MIFCPVWVSDLLDLEGYLDLHGGVPGETSYRNGGSGVETGLPEDFREEIRSSVDCSGALGKGRNGVNVAANEEDLLNPVEAAEDGAKGSQGIEGTDPCGLVPIFKGALGANLPDPGRFSIEKANDSGEVEGLACLTVGQIIATRLRCSWEDEPKFVEVFLGGWVVERHGVGLRSRRRSRQWQKRKRLLEKSRAMPRQNVLR